jgi:hypothetical protein
VDARAQGVILHSKPSARVVLVADERVAFTMKTGERRVVYPGLLDELKLAFKVAVETDEMQAALFCPVIDKRIVQSLPV